MSTTDSQPVFTFSLCHPKYWLSWFAILIFRLIAALPFKAKLTAGKITGLIALRLAKRRRHITATNIRLCFPELSATQQHNLVRDIFIQNGIGFFEIAWSWWATPQQIAGRYTVEGLEHLDKAKANGKGVILLGAHFVHLDLCGLMLNQLTPLSVIYRKNNNPVFEYIITRGRKRVFENVIERSDLRLVIRKLREGCAVWNAPDQDPGSRKSIFAPFFGVKAATLVTTSKLAKAGQANVLGLFHYRHPITHQYRIVFKPFEETFPSGDDNKDATLMNALFEAAIREQPDQYMWVHRRFKTRPSDEPSLY